MDVSDEPLDAGPPSLMRLIVSRPPLPAQATVRTPSADWRGAEYDLDSDF